MLTLNGIKFINLNFIRFTFHCTRRTKYDSKPMKHATFSAIGELAIVMNRIRFMSVVHAALVYSCSLAVAADELIAEEAALPVDLKLHSMDRERSEDATTFVLVHGTSHGAWCWYKVVTMLQERGYNAAALDMTSLGKDKASADEVSTLAEYTKPAVDYIGNVTGKVIVVGHSSGGFAISYIMERCAEKIDKAIFLASRMHLSGEDLGIFDPTNVPEGIVFFRYGNGPNSPPTSLIQNLTYASGIFYNESPKEDITLAVLLLLPHPLQPFSEVLNLTPERYGRIRRFYIRTLRDQAVPESSQRDTIRENPPERVFEIDSDHSPFFSKPEELTSILEEVVNCS